MPKKQSKRMFVLSKKMWKRALTIGVLLQIILVVVFVLNLFIQLWLINSSNLVNVGKVEQNRNSMAGGEFDELSEVPSSDEQITADLVRHRHRGGSWNVRKNVVERTALDLEKKNSVMLDFADHLLPFDFQLCMKHYQREFDTNVKLNNQTRQYPVPFSVFSRNIAGNDSSNKIVASFGGKSLAKSYAELSIENYEDWLLRYKWLVQVNRDPVWNQCKTVKGPWGKGNQVQRTLMVECLIGTAAIKKAKGQRFPPRISFKIIDDENDRLILQIDNLLVCNETPPLNDLVELAACTMVSDDHIYRIPEWLEYHRLIGFQRFTIHVDSPNFEIYQRFLQNYIDRHPKMIELVPFYFETQRRAQDAARHDCLYRTKGISKYVAIFDVDEFFQMKLKNETLLQFLDRNIKGSNWSGIASPTSFFRHCLDEPIGDFQMASEKYQVRHEKANLARRKAIYLSDKIFYIGAHKMMAGEKVKIVDPAQELALNHYRYPPLPTTDLDYEQSELVRDSSMFNELAEIVKREIRQCKYIVEDVPLNERDFSCGRK